MKVWTRLSESDIYAIADEVGVAIAISQVSTERHFGVPNPPPEIPKIGRAFSFGLRPLTSLGKIDGDYKYQRTSASGFRPERRVFAVCWHGHRDFMRALYARDPEARIKSALADYKHSDHFEGTHEDTAYRQVGSQMYPMQMREVCNCWKENW